jgi:hypothetical protein
MLAVSTFLISTDGLATIALCWVLGAALIVSLCLINRRRFKSHDDL